MKNRVRQTGRIPNDPAEHHWARLRRADLSQRVWVGHLAALVAHMGV